MAAKKAENAKLCLILLWVIWPIGLIFYLVDEKLQKDEFVKYHFKQWLVVLITLVIASFVAGILSFLLIGFLLYPIISILGLVWLIQALIAIIKDEKKELFLVGKYAEKLKF